MRNKRQEGTNGKYEYTVPKFCKLCGAENPKDKAYCCRAHSPLGYYDLGDSHDPKGKEKPQDGRSE